MKPHRITPRHSRSCVRALKVHGWAREMYLQWRTPAILPKDWHSGPSPHVCVPVTTACDSRGWGCSSEVDQLSGMHKAPGPTASTEKQNKKQNIPQSFKSWKTVQSMHSAVKIFGGSAAPRAIRTKDFKHFIIKHSETLLVKKPSHVNRVI